MNKYKVKNTVTGEETICEKVVVGSHDYYVSKEQALEGDYGYIDFQDGEVKKIGKHFADDWEKVIATTNKSLDLPIVIDEVEELAEIDSEKCGYFEYENRHHYHIEGFKDGYNKAKETYSFTKDDLINFKQQAPLILEQLNGASDSELFDIWQEQRTKTILVK